MNADYILYIVWGLGCFAIGFMTHYAIQRQLDKEAMTFARDVEADVIQAKRRMIPEFDWGCEWCENNCKVYERAFSDNKDPDDALHSLDNVCSRECPTLKLRDFAEQQI